MVLSEFHNLMLMTRIRMMMRLKVVMLAHTEHPPGARQSAKFRHVLFLLIFPTLYERHTIILILEVKTLRLSKSSKEILTELVLVFTL